LFAIEVISELGLNFEAPRQDRTRQSQLVPWLSGFVMSAQAANGSDLLWNKGNGFAIQIRARCMDQVSIAQACYFSAALPSESARTWHGGFGDFSDDRQNFLWNNLDHILRRH
jgi:hypothetical protein